MNREQEQRNQAPPPGVHRGGVLFHKSSTSSRSISGVDWFNPWWISPGLEQTTGCGEVHLYTLLLQLLFHSSSRADLLFEVVTLQAVLQVQSTASPVHVQPTDNESSRGELSGTFVYQLHRSTPNWTRFFP